MNFYRNEEGLPKISSLIVTVFAIILILIILFGSWFVVQPGERALVFNSFSGLKLNIYDEGIHFKIPLVERAIKMNVMTQKQSEQASAASSDLQDVSTTVAVNFMIDQISLPEIYRTIGQATGTEDYMHTQIMNPIIQESVKSVTAHYRAEELISKRPIVKQEIDELITQRMSKYSIKVIDVSITNFEFSPTFTQAIEAKVTAEQNALKEQNNLKVVEFQAQQKIEQSRGDAEAIKIINEELRKSPQYVQFLMISKWDGRMPLAVGGNSLLNLPTTITGGQ